ncbi:unnamed protein product [Auanema sp. JU1783]|nr:unnamed protein product [Auanema sp. JU1783]
MVSISKADYLKKYLSGGGDDDRKKKKKKKEKEQTSKQSGMKIVDDEAFITVRTEARSDSEDEEELQMIEELKRKARKGPRFKKTFLSADDDEVVEVKQEPLSDEEGAVSFQIRPKESHDPKVKQEVDSDASPQRKRERHDSDKSPRRRHDSDDNSPPRRRARHDSDNDSPPRRRVRHDSDEKSPPRRRARHDSDASPPRRNQDRSPARRRRHDSEDASPPRRRRERHDSDNSPPRRNRSPARRTQRDSEKSSSRRRKERYDSDQSPPRRADNKSPRRKRHDSDNSPPRRRRDNAKDSSPDRKKKRYDSDESPPRRSAADIKKSPPSSPRRRRIASPEIGGRQKTLDGKIAGLQSGKDLKIESEKLKRKEEDLFEFMDPDVSGRNAATVHRQKQVGKRKTDAEDQEKKERESKKQEELQEKYSSWNKGVYQIEERKAKLEELARVVQEPLTRTADDVAMNAHLKHQLYEEDPLHKLIAKNRRHKAIDRGETVYPTYDKPFPPNRFGIRPGYRWDGVDRSNQFEAKLYISKNQKQSDNTSYIQNLGLYD